MKMPNLASRYQSGTLYPWSESHEAWNGPLAICRSTDCRAFWIFCSYVCADSVRANDASAHSSFARTCIDAFEDIRIYGVAELWRCCSLRLTSGQNSFKTLEMASVPSCMPSFSRFSEASRVSGL